MTSKRIVYTRPDGGVDVIVPAPDYLAAFESEDEAMTSLAAKWVPVCWKTVNGSAVCVMPGDPDPGGDVVHTPEVEIVEASALPSDRAFREAWEKSGSGCAVNMTKAHSIWMDRIRAARAPVLAALDIEYQRADEAQDAAAKAQIAQRKRALRALPATFDLSKAKTPEELKGLWPQELRNES